MWCHRGKPRIVQQCHLLMSIGEAIWYLMRPFNLRLCLLCWHFLRFPFYDYISLVRYVQDTKWWPGPKRSFILIWSIMLRRRSLKLATWPSPVDSLDWFYHQRRFTLTEIKKYTNYFYFWALFGNEAGLFFIFTYLNKVITPPNIRVTAWKLKQSTIPCHLWFYIPNDGNSNPLAMLSSFWPLWILQNKSYIL